MATELVAVFVFLPKPLSVLLKIKVLSILSVSTLILEVLITFICRDD